ncbi:hypothetical protein [Borreliella garinii]|uniref:hypothetical protein n=1 Tax=Borreliella garinii TaxID=29519 RepID=UPI001F42DDE1|nr:hypothetical protein [Borreliella garinii]
MYKTFVDDHKSQFDKLNETNRNVLKQMAEKAKDTAKSLYDKCLENLDKFTEFTGKILNQETGEKATSEGIDYAVDSSATKGLVDFGKNTLKAAGAAIGGTVGQAIAEIIIQIGEFIWGIFRGHEKDRIKKIEEKRDKDLEEFEKQSEIALSRLEEIYDAEIEMRKEKLSELDDEYNKEIEFLKQAQSKGQISGEEFQKRLGDVQTEYKTKKGIETTKLTKAEETKKLEVERQNKFSKLETERIKAQAEVDKVNAYGWYFSKASDLEKTQKILDEILKRIATVKSAGSTEEIKLARGGVRFVSNKPTYMPNSGVMSSEFGQPELVRITPAPIDENLRKLEAKIIVEEIAKLQKSQSSTAVNNFTITLMEMCLMLKN